MLNKIYTGVILGKLALPSFPFGYLFAQFFLSNHKKKKKIVQTHITVSSRPKIIQNFRKLPCLNWFGILILFYLWFLIHFWWRNLHRRDRTSYWNNLRWRLSLCFLRLFFKLFFLTFWHKGTEICSFKTFLFYH